MCVIVTIIALLYFFPGCLFFSRLKGAAGLPPKRSCENEPGFPEVFLDEGFPGVVLPAPGFPAPGLPGRLLFAKGFPA